MARYVTTYQTDYVWPYVKTMAIQDRPAAAMPDQRICKCGMDPKAVGLPREFHVALGEVHEWSRLGPMGPLLDPKLFPAKTGPSPESDITKAGQPGIYMKQLEEKYPYLYGVLQSAPPDEICQKVDADRMKTTYQADYTEKAAGIGHRDDLMIAANMEGPHLAPCVTRTGDHPDCQRHIRPRLTKEHKNRKKDGAVDVKCGSGKHRRRQDEDGNPEDMKPPPWKSEYEDVISRTGAAIIKGRIHDTRKKEVPLWAISI